jgi:DNA primase catalytic core
MPLAPRAEIERIKREVSIQRLAETRGIKLRRSGKELIGLCPFHKDTKPSLNIDPKKNVWECKGACSQGGDVFEWVMQAEGISFKHALTMLRRDLLPTSPSADPPPKQSTVPKLPPLIDSTADDKQLLKAVVEYYHEMLKQSPEAQQYLVTRGLKSSEMVEHFRLGFADRTLGYHLPQSNRAAGEEQRGRLKKLGILKNQKPGHEHFSGSLVIPILNLDGDVVQMYGRKILPDSKLRETTSPHLYLPGPLRGVWNEQALIASKEIILCEALIDALTFWCAGYRHVTSIYGVNNFTDELRAALKYHRTERIYIAYDRDDAGEKAAQEHSEELIEMGIECFRVQFPKTVKDANEFALKVQPPAKSLGVMLNRAAWLGKGKRPTVSVIEPAKESDQPQTPATQESMLPAVPELKAERILPQAAEPVFSLAAPLETPRQDAPEPAPMPPLPSTVSPVIDVPVEIRPNGIVVITQRDRRYEIRGLGKNTSYETLRVTVSVSGTNLHGDLAEHTDNLDFYSAQRRTIFAKQASEELGIKEDIVRSELGQVRLKLEEMRDQRLDNALKKPEAEMPQMSAEEQAAALELLRDPRLMDRVLEDFEKCGVVGEETNKTISYLAAVSRLLEKPLAIVVQSASSAGKSSLMEAVLDFVPEEHREEYTAMTGQSLFYMSEKNLKHKILAVSEEAGASAAAYPLKLLQSEGVLRIASTGKDPVSGRHVTHEYKVEGPVMIFLTTTAQNIDEELVNRCMVLTVNEEQEQTRAIHRKQREARTIAGYLARRRRERILRLHRNAQRLLRTMYVVNNHDVGEFPDAQTRTRRDHPKFLTLIDAVALLHQHQREIKTLTDDDGHVLEYIEATEADVRLAEELRDKVIKPSLDDLPPQTRKLLSVIEQMVSQEAERLKLEPGEYRFTRRKLREFTKRGDTQLRMHLRVLEEMEYLRVKHAGPGQSFVYWLRSEAEEGEGETRHNRAGSRGVRGGCAGAGKSEESPAMTRGGGTTVAVRGGIDTEGEAENRIVAVTKPNGHAVAKAAGVK